MKVPLGVDSRHASLVRLLEQWAARSPVVYKLAVLFLALCGYGYLLGLLAIVFLAALITFNILAAFYLIAFAFYALGPFLALAGIILKALWVRLDPPTGFELKPDAAPKLFMVIEQIRMASRSPRIHRVLIDGDFNAGVTQIPRLGVLGWNRNYLTIGLPLMLAVNEQELTAILAHECGHLSGNHGWFGSWIYRLRRAWWYVATALQYQARWSRWLFAPFYKLYVPRFNAFSFVLARSNEYEADRNAVEIVGAQATASALMRVEGSGYFVSQRYWPSVYKNADNHKKPPFPPIAKLRDELSHEPDPSILREGRNTALARPTDLSDTHPSLRDRLSRISGEQSDLMPWSESAAQRLLAASLLEEVVSHFDIDWNIQMEEGWQQYYDQSRTDRRQLNELAAKARNGELSPEEHEKLAMLTERFLGTAEAEPIYRTLSSQPTPPASAVFALGRILIKRDDKSGLLLLESAISQDDRLTMEGLRLMFLHLMRTGDVVAAEEYRKRLEVQQDIEERASEERGPPRRRDEFEDHGLTRPQLDRVLDRLRPFHLLRRAYIARKRVKILPHRPYHVILVQAAVFASEMDFSLSNAVAGAVDLPGEGYIVHVTWRTRWLRRRFKRIPSALILDRG